MAPAIVVFSAWAAGCAPAPEPPPRPNIILISMDTLRADRLGCYNDAEQSLTPWMDTLAANGVQFNNAFVQVAFTLPSHMSMMTGVHPDVHKVDKKNTTLSNDLVTIAETLQPLGYRSVGLVTNNWMEAEFGFDRGFDVYQRIPHALTYAETVNRRLFQLLDGRFSDAEQLFIFLHYLDPHSDFTSVTGNTLPYYAPDAYREHLGIDPLSREFCIEDHCATNYLLEVMRRGITPTPESLARLEELYDTGVRYMDDQLRNLFEGLEQRGILDGALVIVTSDHGEEFMEHGEFIHNQPYVEGLHVPLLVHFPDGRHAGATVDTITQSIDFLPTILEMLELPEPTSVQGRSLLPLVGATSPPQDSTFARSKLNRDLYSLRTADHALLLNIKTGQTELYDRREDPGERLDISDLNPGIVDALSERLMATLSANRELAGAIVEGNRNDSILSAEQKEQLKSIGYVD
jgi:arylsulfatase A-like enzyme